MSGSGAGGGPAHRCSWHMQARLAPLLFTDDDKQAAQATRPSPVAPAVRSRRALAKAATKQAPAALPVLADLGTICLNTIAPADPTLPPTRSAGDAECSFAAGECQEDHREGWGSGRLVTINLALAGGRRGSSEAMPGCPWTG